MTPSLGTAGTAGEGYRCADESHRYTTGRADYGQRQHCGTCGCGPDEPGARHIPTQRGRRA